MDKTNVAGVVLAGGKSSRMGQSKAMLEYEGAPLLDHMMGLLSKLGLSKSYVSGEFEGYSCVADTAPHEGPARAICDVLSALKTYDGVLFIPVDMPFLTAELLDVLLSQEGGAYFKDKPLPVFIKQNNIVSDCSSVRDLLNELNVPSIPLPINFKEQMININTQEEWKEMVKS
jgi:molybdopterin-guanine dinucleotide biosynthesis protein A